MPWRLKIFFVPEWERTRDPLDLRPLDCLDQLGPYYMSYSKTFNLLVDL